MPTNPITSSILSLPDEIVALINAELRHNSRVSFAYTNYIDILNFALIGKKFYGSFIKFLQQELAQQLRYYGLTLTDQGREASKKLKLIQLIDNFMPIAHQPIISTRNPFETAPGFSASIVQVINKNFTDQEQSANPIIQCLIGLTYYFSFIQQLSEPCFNFSKNTPNKALAYFNEATTGIVECKEISEIISSIDNNNNLQLDNNQLTSAKFMGIKTYLLGNSNLQAHQKHYVFKLYLFFPPFFSQRLLEFLEYMKEDADKKLLTYLNNLSLLEIILTNLPLFKTQKLPLYNLLQISVGTPQIKKLYELIYRLLTKHTGIFSTPEKEWTKQDFEWLVSKKDLKSESSNIAIKIEELNFIEKIYSLLEEGVSFHDFITIAYLGNELISTQKTILIQLINSLSLSATLLVQLSKAGIQGYSNPSTIAMKNFLALKPATCQEVLRTYRNENPNKQIGTLTDLTELLNEMIKRAKQHESLTNTNNMATSNYSFWTPLPASHPQLTPNNTLSLPLSINSPSKRPNPDNHNTVEQSNQKKHMNTDPHQFRPGSRS